MENSFGYTSDKIQSKEFVSQEKILKYVSEEQVFSLVFGFEPEEYQYVTSPLRNDDEQAGCWFEYYKGRLFFRDFAYSTRPLDCFHVVKDYFNLQDFPSSLRFVKEKLIDTQTELKERTVTLKEEREKFYMKISTRQFLRKDALFWSKYDISRQNLLDDNVFAVNRAFLYNTKSGDISANFNNRLCYAFTEFQEGRKKLYLPQQQEKRFITDCTKDDIGSIKHLVPFGRLLFITKSYKDCRVIRNQGYNCIWFQNEGMIPSDDILYNLVKNFDNIVIFYDNDSAGIESSQNISNKVNLWFPKKSKALWLPESLNEKGISDASDYYYKKSKVELNKFLKKNESFKENT